MLPVLSVDDGDEPKVHQHDRIAAVVEHDVVGLEGAGEAGGRGG